MAPGSSDDDAAAAAHASATDQRVAEAGSQRRRRSPSRRQRSRSASPRASPPAGFRDRRESTPTNKVTPLKGEPPLPDEEPPASSSDKDEQQSPVSDEVPAGSTEQPPLPEGEEPPTSAEQPPLPDEPLPGDQPPLPTEPLPTDQPPLPAEAPPDDGWEPVWEPTANAYYFYNRFTQATQWENPRVPSASTTPLAAPPGTTAAASIAASSMSPPPALTHGGYNPAIHGSYDPNADYAIAAREAEEAAARAALYPGGSAVDAAGVEYTAEGHFNRFTGKWQPAHVTPELHNDENKSRRQLNAFFDVDAAANSHDGRSLKAERQQQRLSKQELKAFREKRKMRKEEKRRAWLRD